MLSTVKPYDSIIENNNKIESKIILFISVHYFLSSFLSQTYIALTRGAAIPP